MEIRSRLMYSNDPRFINTAFKKIGNEYHYEDHEKKIIRHGYFNTQHPVLNGFGTFISYANNITAIIGYFMDDIPIDTYFLIEPEELYFYDRCYYDKWSQEYKIYCKATQTEYSSIAGLVKEQKKISIFLQIDILKDIPKKIKKHKYIEYDSDIHDIYILPPPPILIRQMSYPNTFN